MTRLICSAFLAGLVAAGLFAQAPAAAAAAAGEARLLEQSEPALGPVAIREYRAQTYFHLVRRASQKTMPEVMKQAFPELLAAAEKASVMPLGGAVVVYKNVTPDPDAEFEVQIGVLVNTGTAASGEAKVRELEAFRSASLLYSGSLDQIGEAYMRLYQTLMAGGKMPTQEMRQMILYWEDETSDSNVMLLQVGLQ